MFALVSTSLAYYMNMSEKLDVLGARSAAWHLSMVSDAARVFVRDNAQDPAVVSGADINGDGVADDTFYVSNLWDTGAGLPVPKAVTIPQLQNAGLLPDDFAPVNILGQSVGISVVAHPFGFDPDTVLDPVPVAFAYLPPTQKSSAGTMRELMFEASRYNLKVFAPLVDDTGTNISADCDTPYIASPSPKVAEWTGIDPADPANLEYKDCFGEDEFTMLMGTAFVPGALLFPTISKVETGNNARLVSRYKRPDAPEATRMATDLEFAQTDRNGTVIDPNLTAFCNSHFSATHKTLNGSVETISFDGDGGRPKICDITAADDEALNEDNRVDMFNIRKIVTDYMLIKDQGGDEFSADSSGTVLSSVDGQSFSDSRVTNEVLNVNGTLSVKRGDFYATDRMSNPFATGGTYYSKVRFDNDLSTHRATRVAGGDPMVHPGASSLHVDDLADWVAVRDLTVSHIEGASARATIGRTGSASPGRLIVDTDLTADRIAMRDVHNGWSVDNGATISGDLNIAAVSNGNLEEMDTVTILNTLRAGTLKIGVGAGTSEIPLDGSGALLRMVGASSELDIDDDIHMLGIGSESMTFLGTATIHGDTRIKTCVGAACPDVRYSNTGGTISGTLSDPADIGSN